ncbi:MAG: Holliday junction DNA helicase RuvA [Proteobacteria bacterium]|nr:Holliday junction DNA helicase RuvA [Pseudomonadota bacterium]
MIGYLSGKLLKKEDDRILLLVGQVGYEIMVPAVVMKTLHSKEIGNEVSLYIYFHQTEKSPKPALIGFNLEAEKEFFLHFISVEDIGPLKAVKAMEIPVKEIARAIEARDAAKLKQLKGIGARTAQKIIASLEGKVTRYALIEEGEIHTVVPIEDFMQQVMDVLVQQLGHKLLDARRLVTEAMERDSSISTPEALFDEIYKGEMR